MQFKDISSIGNTFIIAEAGSNWKCGTFKEDLAQAKKLIDVAKNSGADAVKFQTYRSDTVYAPDAGKSEYLDKHDFSDDINKIFDYLSMPYEMIPKIAEYCAQKNIHFMSTPFSVDDAKHIDPYVSIHKVASFEINHIRLLEYLCKTNKPIIISTGASTYEEIDFCIDLIKKTSNSKIALLQCTSCYPAPTKSLNLLSIPSMKRRYKIPIGLSDHSTDPLMAPIMTIALGGTIIEKHFTLSRKLIGPDHIFALEPEELKLMVQTIRQAEQALGNGKKRVLDVEQELRKFAKRSLQATSDIEKGEILKEGHNFDTLRPGKRLRGLDAKFLNEINGKKTKKIVKKGEGIIEYE